MQDSIPVLTESALLSMHIEPLPTATEEFALGGKKFRIKIAADGMVNGARLAQLAGCHQKAILDCGKIEDAPKPETIGLRFTLPPTMGGETIHITDPAYLTQLYILEAVAIEPKFAAIQWAIAGRAMADSIEWERLLDWATTTNGFDQYLMMKIAKIGKLAGKAQDGDQKGSPTSSTRRAGTSSRASRKRS